MSELEKIAKAGTLVCVDRGEYSDYEVTGFFVVLRERIVRVQRELDAALEVMDASAKAGAAWAARAQELEAERDHFRGATEMVSEEQKRPTYQQVVAAWNAQADEHNPWDALGEDEKIEWALQCRDQIRGVTECAGSPGVQPGVESADGAAVLKGGCA